ncbi:hypothetical protein [Yoonia sp.]|uniref:hypothetical protein n=1 Tax=Yoonia sp. TaxID=2212373 RepID=UPI002FD9F2F2
MPLSMPTVDFIGEEILNCREVSETGDCDIFVRRADRPPALSAARHDTATVLVDMVWPDGRAVETSCRHVLRKVIAAYAEAGLTPVAALEVGFYLFDPGQPGLVLPRHPVSGKAMFGRDPCHLDEFEIFGSFFRDVRQSLRGRRYRGGRSGVGKRHRDVRDQHRAYLGHHEGGR